MVMAVDKIKTLAKSIIVEEVTVCSAASASTYYASYSKTVSKSGYTAVGVVGVNSNQGQMYSYTWQVINGTVTVAVLARAGTGTISNLTIKTEILWVKDELL